MDFSTSSGTFRRLALILVLLAGPARPSIAGFTITDLGAITPTGTSAGAAINALGQVAGSASTATGSMVAVKTNNGRFEAISGSVLGNSSQANAINVLNSVAGTYIDTGGTSHGFYTSAGGLNTINPLAGGTYTQANGINKYSQVVGTGDIGNGVTRAFVVGSGGTPTAIAPLANGTSNVGNGINDNGTVVGTSQIAPQNQPGGFVHAFIAAAGGAPTDLLTRNPSTEFVYNTYGKAIANNGDVAGYGDIGLFEHAFYAPSGGGALVDLGVLAGGSSSIAYGLNDLAQVVGAVSFGGGQTNSQAFIWDSILGMFNLNTLISSADQANWVLTQATGINDNDQITGVGLLNGTLHGFLLTPIPGEPLFSTPSAVPEPSALGLSAIGLAIVGAWSKLRRGRTSGRAAA